MTDWQLLTLILLVIIFGQGLIINHQDKQIDRLKHTIQFIKYGKE